MGSSAPTNPASRAPFEPMMLDVRSLLFFVVAAKEGQAVKCGDVITFRQLAELLEERPAVLFYSLASLLASNCETIRDNEGIFMFEIGWNEKTMP